MLNILKRKEEVNFLELNIKLIDGEFKTICLLKLQILIGFLAQFYAIFVTAKNQYFTVQA